MQVLYSLRRTWIQCEFSLSSFYNYKCLRCLDRHRLHAKVDDDSADIKTQCCLVHEFSKIVFPPVVDPFHIRSNTCLQKIGLDTLLTFRQLHQTRQAATGVRTARISPTAAVPQTPQIRRNILRKLTQVLKLEEEVAPDSGVERSTRWTGTTTGGNSANAALAFDMDAKRSLVRMSDKNGSFRTYIGIIRGL